MAITQIGGSEDSSEIVAEINITPLTDIFLVLLIIFMITSSAMIESGGKVNLPKAVATQSESRGTTVTITPKHEIFVLFHFGRLDAGRTLHGARNVVDARVRL